MNRCPCLAVEPTCVHSPVSVLEHAPHDAVALGHARLDGPLDVADVVVDVGAAAADAEGRLVPAQCSSVNHLRF